MDVAKTKNTQASDKATIVTGPEGEIYVSNSSEISYFVKPKIDADKIRDIGFNNYMSEQVEKLSGLLFSGGMSLVVLDDKGEEDTEIETNMMRMCERTEVKLWSAIQMAWADIFQWGPAVFNPVWGTDDDGLISIQKLRRLPPESFGTAPGDMADKTIWSEVLKGIVYNAKTKSVEYWQTAGSDGKPVMLDSKAIVMLKDPKSKGLGGTSKFIPIVVVVSMLDYAWQAQMQKVNRVGSPIMFIKVANPITNAKRNDIEYAAKILKNWGKGTGYQLRENMEIVDLKFCDNQSASATIEMLQSRIRDYFSPSTMIKKEGATIGGNAGAEADLVKAWIQGIHSWVTDQFESILQTYLDVNGYEGYSVQIELSIPEPDRTTTNIQRATAASQIGCATTNEMREMLGLPDLTPEEQQVLEEQKKSQAPPASPFGFKKGCTHKEHQVTPEERELADNLKKSQAALKAKVLKALDDERGLGQ